MRNGRNLLMTAALAAAAAGACGLMAADAPKSDKAPAPAASAAEKKDIWAFLPNELASVGSQKITKDEFLKYLGSKIPEGALPQDIPEDQLKTIVRDQILPEFINKIVFTKIVEKAGIKPSEKMVSEDFDSWIKSLKPAELESVKERLKAQGTTIDDYKKKVCSDPDFQLMKAVEKWVRLECEPKVKTTDADAQKYYEENKDRYKIPESYNASHILIKAMHENLAEADAQGKINADKLNIKDAKIATDANVDASNLKDGEKAAADKLSRENLRDPKISEHVSRDSAQSKTESSTGKNKELTNNIQTGQNTLAEDVSALADNTKMEFKQGEDRYKDRENFAVANKNARERAEGLRARLDKGEDFGKLAAENSDCPSKAKKGELGECEPGEMDENFEKAALALEPGKISGVVKTQFGYHIIKLNSKTKAGMKPYDSVKKEIGEELKNKAVQEKVQKVFEDEKKVLGVKVNI
jgi:parvulin-like peptidyl-prolyl isomerase